MTMLGYVTLGTSDLAKAGAFYDALLGEIGASRFMDTDMFVVWGTDPGRPMLSVNSPFDGKAASVGNGVMVAIQVDTTQQVDKLYAKALELGASDEGAAGPRGEGFYAGYFRDLDGNKLNFFKAG
jgi:predicted lactoylglutathione lyase